MFQEDGTAGPKVSLDSDLSQREQPGGGPTGADPFSELVGCSRHHKGCNSFN